MKNKKEMKLAYELNLFGQKMLPPFVREMDLDDYPDLHELAGIANAIIELLGLVNHHQKEGWDDDLPEVLRAISTLTIPNLPNAKSTLGECYLRLLMSFALHDHKAEVINDGV